MQYRVRELGLGAILDQSINLLRDHFGQLFGMVAMTIVPYFMIVGLVKVSIFVPGDLQSLWTSLIVDAVGILIFTFLFGPLVHAAVIHAVTNAYLSRPTTIGACFSHGLRRYWALFGTSLLMRVAVVGGLVLCLVPGIIFLFWFLLAPCIAVLESTAGLAALERSKALIKGNILTGFVLGVVVGAINAGMTLGAIVIPQPHAQVVAVAIVQGIATLLDTCALVVFYFSCRCKFENYDLLFLANAVAAGADAPSAVKSSG